jgi:hypothetical protein
MKLFFCILAGVVIGIQSVSALTINEIFSNPIGDDGGREWVELYNDSDSLVDISSLTIAIKGGNPVIATPVSGGTIIPPYGYAIVGSTVSSATRFLQDYPEYSGVLFKSSIGLVNTGVTSIDIRLGGLVVDSVSSYTAAKEGKSYAKINGQFLTTVPSPGKENTIDVCRQQYLKCHHRQLTLFSIFLLKKWSLLALLQSFLFTLLQIQENLYKILCTVGLLEMEDIQPEVRRCIVICIQECTLCMLMGQMELWLVKQE